MNNKIKKVILAAMLLNLLPAQNQKRADGGSASEPKYIVNLQNNFGYSIVDVGQAMDISEFSEVTNTGLNDWDQFNYKGLIQIFLNRDKMLLGAELGFNRLYSWEERYKTSMDYDRWRWGTIWTWHLGALIQINIAEQYYFTTGAGLYNFFNGSGTTVGFPLAVGHVIKFNDKISLPIEFRTDIIFGDGTPITLGGGIGLKFEI